MYAVHLGRFVEQCVRHLSYVLAVISLIEYDFV